MTYSVLYSAQCYMLLVYVCVHSQDLNDLVGLCMSTSWSERKDGIAQLHMLLESSRPFS